MMCSLRRCPLRFEAASDDHLLMRGTLRVGGDLVVALGLLIAVGTWLSIDQYYTGFFVSLASTLAGLGYLSGCAVAIITWMVRRRWVRAGLSAIKATTFLLLLGPCLRAGDYVHLAMFYPSYHRQIREQDAGDTAPMRFDWGDKALWVTDGFQGETLVYDPTDALAAVVGDVRAGGRNGLGLATLQLIGHFYVELEFSN